MYSEITTYNGEKIKAVTSTDVMNYALSIGKIDSVGAKAFFNAFRIIEGWAWADKRFKGTTVRGDFTSLLTETKAFGIRLEVMPIVLESYLTQFPELISPGSKHSVLKATFAEFCNALLTPYEAK